MPFMKITKEAVEKAQKAREEALKKDPDFWTFEEELEKQDKEAVEQSTLLRWKLA